MASRFVLYAALTILFAAVLAAAASQESASATGVPVSMVVTAETRHGYSVPVINREEVMVYEGRDRDKVTDWVPAPGEQGGLGFVQALCKWHRGANSPTPTSYFRRSVEKKE